jgi:hypothetical protein
MMPLVYKRLNGDGTIIARVDSLTNTNAWAKAGVMIRESLDWGSRHASVFITPGNGVAFQRRLANNDAGQSTAQAGVTVPHWVKLTRSGNTLTAQHSADGVTWGDVVHATNPTSDTVVLSGTIYIGLVLTSHVSGVAGTPCSVGQIAGRARLWQMAEICWLGMCARPVCTSPSRIPGRAVTVTTPTRGYPPDGLAIWAIDLNAFRAAA